MVDDRTRASRETLPQNLQPIKRWTPELVMDVVRGHVRIFRFGNDVSFKLSRKELAEFERTKERGFAVTRYRWNNALLAAWFHWCDATGRAYVYVTPRRTRADVEMDLIATAEEVPKSRYDEFSKMLASLQDDVGAPNLWMSPVTVTMMRVPLQHAERVAAALVNFAQDAKRCGYLDTGRCSVPCGRNHGTTGILVQADGTLH